MNLTEQLLKLYRVDEQLQALKSRLTGAQRYYNAQNRKVEELDDQKRALREQMKRASAAAANHENDARTIEDRMNKLRERMSQSKTNKEYNAFLTELNTIKIEKEQAESQALESMTEVEELQGKLQTIDAQLVEREKVREVARKDYDERQAAIADRLAELKAEREQAAQDVPDHALAEYEEQLDWHDGEAMAPVFEQDRRNMEYACGACHMTIPIERLSSLLGRGDITPCPSCHRILFVDTELKAAFDKRLAKS